MTMTSSQEPRFELYHTLNQNIAKKDLKRVEKEEIIRAIPAFKNDEAQALYDLILEDHKFEEEGDQNAIPYGGKRRNKNSIEFDLANFPIRLRRIIYKFVKIIQKNEQIELSP